ncbi:MAG: diguanylate cyclase [Gammaproteobacteria bacterium]|nr:diguanylate cyclase [Gammaproteobacteria bacterium]
MFEIGKKILLQALDNGSAGTVILDARGSTCTVLYANAAMEDLTGWDVSELHGRDLGELLASGELPHAEDGLPGGNRVLAQRWHCRDGGEQRIDFQLAPLFDRPGAPAYWLLSQVPGPDAPRVLRRSGRSGSLDVLTGLSNRQAFDELLRRDWGIARREQRNLTMILFRVNELDAYRDLFGRHSTDSCLRKVAHAISGSLHRAGDAVARIDTGDFVVLIGGAGKSQAADFAARIAAKVRELAIHHPRSGVERYVTVSFGIGSATPTRNAAADSLLNEAEAGLRAQIDARERDTADDRASDAG